MYTSQANTPAVACTQVRTPHTVRCCGDTKTASTWMVSRYLSVSDLSDHRAAAAGTAKAVDMRLADEDSRTETLQGGQVVWMCIFVHV